MSIDMGELERIALSGLMPFGQETTNGLRVPPKWAATSLVLRNGVDPAHAQPA